MNDSAKYMLKLIWNQYDGTQTRLGSNYVICVLDDAPVLRLILFVRLSLVYGTF